MTDTTCRRVDAKGRLCGGAFEDGICDTCGRPAVAGSLLAAAAVAATAAQTATAAPGATTSRGATLVRATVNQSANSTAPRGTAPGATTGTATRGATATRATASRGSRSSRRQSQGTTSRRQSLGGGLVSLPPVPSQDPLALVIERPEAALGRRRCPHCDARVNRSKGFCPQCSEAYDFEPKLKAGEVVAGKYEIRGPIAFGGMGWIYLGWDRILSRWVILKGLLNSKDPEAVAAALAERQFLAAVKHARIVGIYDFVMQGSEGFMVLEYIGGRTAESLREDKGPLKPEAAMAYILGILPAFSYLHAQGFVYCDFKPANLMIESDDVKLIDMGAVRRLGDPEGAVFGTDGYSAREAADEPTVASDLYTIGRTLAVLSMDFLYRVSRDTDPVTGAVTTSRRMRADFVHTLPTPDEQPVLAANEPLYRFLLRATHDDPDQRFQSADEMEGQLFGVLRETVAATSGPRPAESRVFFGDGLVDGADREGTQRPLVRLLPQLRLDAADSAAGDILALAAIFDPARRIEALEALLRKRGDSVEARLRLADALIAADTTKAALALVADVLQANAFEWRAHWYGGKAHLAAGRPAEAFDAFDRVYFEMPGELAPKLALGFAAEAVGDAGRAAGFYRRVAATDPSYASACFGLARCLVASGESQAAVAALEAVPAPHSLSTEARLQMAELLIGAAAGADAAPIERAGRVLASITARNGQIHQLTARLFATALRPILTGVEPPARDRSLLGQPMTVEALRRAAEREYLAAARFAASAGEKAMLVDLAHAVRPLTLV